MSVSYIPKGAILDNFRIRRVYWSSYYEDDIRGYLFQITDIEYDATYFKKTKKETGFDISFTEKEPPKKIDIVIKGKEKEGENSTDVLLNIIISLNINKEGK